MMYKLFQPSKNSYCKVNKSLKRIVHCIVRIDSPTDVADVIVVEGVTDVDADVEFEACEVAVDAALDIRR